MPAEHRILLTGANGFVGGWLQRELEARRRSVKLEVFPAGHLASQERDVDVTDFGQVERLVREVRPTAVIHLAAVAAPADARKAPFRAWEVNLNGTMNLAYAVLAAVPEARFVFASSSEVYGASFNDTPAGQPVWESAALKPLSVYGATKAAADILVAQLANDGLKSIRFRPFNHTGPGQSEAYVVPAFAKQIAEIAAGRRPPMIDVGDLQVYRDFLDVRDVVRAYADAALLDIPEAYGQAFNLASGRTHQIRSILASLSELSDLQIDVRVDPRRLRRVEVPSASGNAEAAARMFGWRPEIPLEKTLSDVLEEWKAKADIKFLKP
jgi:GDP-4-dehydro-6-deoxy-D-mannose reductase